MTQFRIVILDDDYMASQALSNAAKSSGIESLVYREASSFYMDITSNSFTENDVFILDLMLRNEGLPSELKESEAQTGQIMLKVLRETLPRAFIYVVTAWNLREEDPHGTSKYANRVFSKPCRYRSVIREIIAEAGNTKGR